MAHVDHQVEAVELAVGAAAAGAGWIAAILPQRRDVIPAARGVTDERAAVVDADQIAQGDAGDRPRRAADVVERRRRGDRAGDLGQAGDAGVREAGAAGERVAGARGRRALELFDLDDPRARSGRLTLTAAW